MSSMNSVPTVALNVPDESLYENDIPVCVPAANRLEIWSCIASIAPVESNSPDAFKRSARYLALVAILIYLPY